MSERLPTVGEKWIIKNALYAVPVTVRRIENGLVWFQAEGRQEGFKMLRHFMDSFEPYATVEDQTQ